MLQIYIHNENNSGFLDLTPGTRLEIESLQESFDEDITSGEFTLPIDIEWTDNNRRLLSFAERVENFKRVENFWICTVYDKMFPELIRAKFTVLGKKGNFNYRNGKFSASISGTKGLYGSAIKNKKLADLKLGGIIEWTAMDSRQFAYSHATGGQPAYPQISFATVAIEKFFNEDRKDFNSEFLATDTVNTTIVGTSSWIFGRPSPDNESVAIASGMDGYADYRTVPFFKMQFILKECFLHFGFEVTGDFITDPAFANMVVFNNYGIENMSTAHQDFNRKIVPSNHVPDMLIGEWLKALFTLTSMFPIFLDNNQVRLVYHKTDITVKQIIGIDEFISGDFESDYLDGTALENGYKIAYVWDSADQYFSERVKDLSDKIITGTVATVVDLLTFTIGRTFTTDDLVFVQSENMYYQVADATSTPVKYDAYSENMGEYKTGNGEKTIEIKISTLCTYVELNTTLALYVRHNFVGCRQNGSYINAAGALVKSEFGNRVFYISNQSFGASTIPVSYNHNRNAANQIICPYSLSINGANGLAESFHVPWQNIIENAELVKIVAQGNQKVLHILRTYNRFQIAGTLFLLKKIERTIPQGATIKLELIPL